MENRNYNFLDNEKGGLMLSDANGYLYWKHSEKRNTRDETRGYWRCIYCKEGPNGEKESSCKGYGSLFDNILKVTTNHTHEPYEDVVVLKEFEGRIRQMLSPGETSALVALGSYYQNNERRLRHQLQDFPHHSYPAFWGYTRDFFLGNDPKYYYAPYMRSQLLSPHYHCDAKTGGYVLCEPFHPCWSAYSMY
ncbi:hypothetical protein DdX_20859 [Ditylenchus destructor]|uniref:FLYWCH-type domain-containing protein n=1 Tax=Ditylenchus destructor TaxID=166010 RepID=A0AAD4MFN1_9BILA|nr:hypothetical protein DdX_20859 [Ditylenchus destructor]